jgi:hypothetical protein
MDSVQHGVSVVKFRDCNMTFYSKFILIQSCYTI